MAKFLEFWIAKAVVELIVSAGIIIFIAIVASIVVYMDKRWEKKHGPK